MSSHCVTHLCCHIYGLIYRYGHIQRWETEDAASSTNLDEATEGQEGRGVPILFLQYVAPPAGFCRGKDDKDSGVSHKFQPPEYNHHLSASPSLLIATPVALIGADMRSFCTHMVMSFQRSSIMEDGTGSALFHCYTTWQGVTKTVEQTPENILYCVGGGAFEHSIHIEMLSCTEDIGYAAGSQPSEAKAQSKQKDQFFQFGDKVTDKDSINEPLSVMNEFILTMVRIAQHARAGVHVRRTPS